MNRRDFMLGVAAAPLVAALEAPPPKLSLVEFAQRISAPRRLFPFQVALLEAIERGERFTYVWPQRRGKSEAIRQLEALRRRMQGEWMPTA